MSNSFKNNESLHDGLKKKHYFALRFGELRLANKNKPWQQWRVKDGKISKLKDRKMEAKDLTPPRNHSKGGRHENGA